MLIPEGKAAAYTSARYADLAVAPNGASVLAGLRDKDQTKL